MNRPLTGVIHRDANGVFWFDDVPVKGPDDVPRGKAWRNTRFYCTEGIPAVEWAKLLSPNDYAFGPQPGTLLGVSFACNGKGRYTVLNGSTWGVTTRDPNKAYQNIRSLQALAVAAGLRIRGSIAATAVGAYMDLFDGKGARPRLTQLPCRWRGMAHAALHGGPISVLRGSASYAAQIDVRRAYLDALYQDVPVLGRKDDAKVGGYFTHSDCRWKTVRKHVGFVDATVRVHERPHDGTYLPPLPVHLRVGSVFATGTLRGCWTIAQVRDAEERGEIEVTKVHQFAFAPQTQPLFAEIADHFLSMPGELGKRLYTRFWGKFGSRGGYVARVSTEPVYGEVPSSGFWWSYDGVSLDDPKAKPTYRPDLAAFVAAYNHRRVFEAIRTLKPGSLVATHVDAIWTTDVAGAAAVTGDPSRVGSWRVKRTGPLRFYGIGCYDHAGQVGASGYDSQRYGKATSESVKRWIQSPRATHKKFLIHARDWRSDPAFDAQASSTPVHLAMNTSISPMEGPEIEDPKWTFGGWTRATRDDAVDPDGDGPPTS